VLGYEHPSRRWVLDSKSVLEKYLGGSPTEQPERYAAASPINFVNAATPPTLLIHGSLDAMVLAGAEPAPRRASAELSQAAPPAAAAVGHARL
jgi:hypothetical protein